MQFLNNMYTTGRKMKNQLCIQYFLIFKLVFCDPVEHDVTDINIFHNIPRTKYLMEKRRAFFARLYLLVLASLEFAKTSFYKVPGLE